MEPLFLFFFFFFIFFSFFKKTKSQQRTWRGPGGQSWWWWLSSVWNISSISNLFCHFRKVETSLVCPLNQAIFWIWIITFLKHFLTKAKENMLDCTKVMIYSSVHSVLTKLLKKRSHVSFEILAHHAFSHVRYIVKRKKTIQYSTK